MSQRVGFRVYRTGPSSLDRDARSSSALCRYKVVKELVEQEPVYAHATKKAEYGDMMSQHDAVAKEQ